MSRWRSPEQRALRRQRLAAVERACDPLPVDTDVAVAYAEVAATVRSAGRHPRARAFDLLIAATAVAHGARLLTRNVDDFRGVEHLLLVERPSG